MKPDRLSLAAALFAVVVWGSDFVGIRAVAGDFSPGPLALATLTVASCALTLAAGTRASMRLRPREIGLVGASGLLWFAAYNLALNAAEHTADAGTAAMLVSTGPILIAILAGVFLGEGFPPRLVLGSLVAFVGAVLIAFSTPTASLGPSTGLGAALAILAAVAYAGGVTLQKTIMGRVSALQVTWLGCLAGALVCLPFAPQLVDELRAAPLTSVAWVAYLGLIPTAVASTSWAIALSRSPAGSLGLMTYLVPPVAIGLSGLLLHELPPYPTLLGGAICIGGVVLGRWTTSIPDSS